MVTKNQPIGCLAHAVSGTFYRNRRGYRTPPGPIFGRNISSIAARTVLFQVGTTFATELLNF